jgi:hypothetical protein
VPLLFPWSETEKGCRSARDQRQSVKGCKGQTHGFWNLMRGWPCTHKPQDISTVLPCLFMKMPKQKLPDPPEGGKRALSGEWKVPMTEPSVCGHAHKRLHVAASPDTTSKTWNERSLQRAYTGVVLKGLLHIKGKTDRKFPLRHQVAFPVNGFSTSFSRDKTAEA